MESSPRPEPLYRTARRHVIFAVAALVLGHALSAQLTPPVPKASKGPRALGLIELMPSGRAHLVPVVIMYNGEFYDATAYKASPVPMALESGTVYEAVKDGVSQGLFTVKGARHVEDNNMWVGEGTWQSAEAIAAAEAAAAKRKAAATAKQHEEEDAKPPVLRHGGPKPKAPEPIPPPSPSPSASTAPSATPTAPTAQAPAPQPPSEDPDRPVLRRGKPQAEEKPSAPPPAAPPKSTVPVAGKGGTTAASGTQFIPAISDVGGPDPRPYAYLMKPDEEQQFRKKMLAMAAELLAARAKQLTGDAKSTTIGRQPSARGATRSAQPSFSDVQLRVFDLFNSNAPVLVLMAKAQASANHSATKAGTNPDQFITLVARDDIYGELHTALSNITDGQHLDVTPRMELIDAVDADGDGRGELLFRQVTDIGSAFSLYRVIGNQLWPLFQGTPGR